MECREKPHMDRYKGLRTTRFMSPAVRPHLYAPPDWDLGYFDRLIFVAQGVHFRTKFNEINEEHQILNIIHSTSAIINCKKVLLSAVQLAYVYVKESVAKTFTACTTPVLSRLLGGCGVFRRWMSWIKDLLWYTWSHAHSVSTDKYKDKEIQRW
jgi:hypothetical protein